MTRYFFDFHDGQRFTPDDVGMEFESIEHAKREAAETLGEICKDAARRCDHDADISVDVRDEQGLQFSAKLIFELK